jgi:hypothetical protein
VVEPDVECPDADPNDVAFIDVTATIGGRDAIKEFVACKMYPLGSGFGFKDMVVGTTPMSKVQTPLPVFPMGTAFVEGASHLLVKIETEAEKMLRSFGPKEYDTLSTVNLTNGGHLNRVFEQMGWLMLHSHFPELKPSRRQKRNAKMKC